MTAETAQSQNRNLTTTSVTPQTVPQHKHLPVYASLTLYNSEAIIVPH